MRHGEEYFICLDCAWFGSEPTKHDKREYDGMDCAPHRVSTYFTCPECGGELEDRDLCTMCSKAPADNNDGLCVNCDNESKRLIATLKDIALTPRKP